MVGHKYLDSVGDHYFRIFYAALLYIIELFYKVRDIKRHARPDYVYSVFVKNSGWHLVKREFSVIIYNRMSGVASSLESDNYVSLRRKQVGYFSLTFVAPVGSYYCFDHIDHLCLIYKTKIELQLIISYTYIKVK